MDDTGLISTESRAKVSEKNLKEKYPLLNEIFYKCQCVHPDSITQPQTDGGKISGEVKIDGFLIATMNIWCENGQDSTRCETLFLYARFFFSASRFTITKTHTHFTS